MCVGASNPEASFGFVFRQKKASLSTYVDSTRVYMNNWPPQIDLILWSVLSHQHTMKILNFCDKFCKRSQ